MGNFNWRKMYAIKKLYLEKVGKEITEEPGIYIWTREDKEKNKIYYYVGKAKNLRNRRFDYYKIQTGLAYPTRHFEASLKKHKDWEYKIITTCSLDQLDELEQYWIDWYAKQDNYITRNESLTGNDIVKSNYSRIERIQKKFDKQLEKLLKHLIVKTKENEIIITPETKKNGDPTKIGLDCFEELKKMLEVSK